VKQPDAESPGCEGGTALPEASVRRVWSPGEGRLRGRGASNTYYLGHRAIIAVQTGADGRVVSCVLGRVKEICRSSWVAYAAADKVARCS
jgi:hypothetical protein